MRPIVKFHRVKYPASLAASLQTAKCRLAQTILIFGLALIALATNPLLRADESPKPEVANILVAQNPVPSPVVQWAGVMEPWELSDLWLAGDALHPSKRRPVQPCEWQIAVQGDAGSEPEGASLYHYANKSYWVDTVFRPSNADFSSAWAGPALPLWLTAPVSNLGFAELAPTATPTTSGANWLTPFALDGANPVAFVTREYFPLPRATWSASAAGSELAALKLAGAPPQQGSPSVATSTASPLILPVFTPSKNATFVETALPTRAASSQLLGPYSVTAGVTTVNRNLTVHAVFTPLTPPDPTQTAEVQGSTSVSNVTSGTNAYLNFTGYAGYQFDGPVSASANGKSDPWGFAYVGQINIGSSTDVAAPVYLSNGVSASGRFASVSVYSSALTLLGDAAATGGGVILLSGANDYLSTQTDQYAVWDATGTALVLQSLTRVYGSSTSVVNPVAASITATNVNGKSVTANFNVVSSVAPAGSTSTFTGNLSATASSLTYQKFANQVFTSAQTITATGGGTVTVRGLSANPALSTLSLDAGLTLGAGSTLNFLDFQTLTLGTTASNALLVGAGTLNFAGLGDGSTFTLPSGVPLGATATGASLTIGSATSSQSFQSFLDTGHAVSATGGGTVTIYGTGSSASQLTLGKGTPVTVAGLNSSNLSNLIFQNFATMNLLGDANGQYVSAGNSNLSFLGGAQGVTIGSAGSPVNLVASGYNPFLGLNSYKDFYGYGVAYGPMKSFSFWGNVVASGSTPLVYIDGSPDGTTSTNFTGNLSLSGGNNSILAYRYFMDQVFTPSQTITASGGGSPQVQLVGATGNLPHDTLVLNPTLAISSGGPSVTFSGYHTVTAGSDPKAGLLLSSGNLNILSSGQSGSSFTAAGAATIGSKAYFTGINIGQGTSNGFETFTALPNANPNVPTIQASGGGAVNIWGNGSAASNLNINPGTNLQIGGTSGLTSSINAQGFFTTNILTDLVTSVYGSLGIVNVAGGTFNLGSQATPINLNGYGAWGNLTFGSPSGKPVTINFWGQATAYYRDNVIFYNSPTDASPGAFNLASPTATFTVGGGLALIWVDAFPGQTYTSRQTFYMENGGEIHLQGAPGLTDQTKNFLNLDARLLYGPYDTNSPGSDLMLFDQFKTVTVGSTASAYLLVNKGWTSLTFTGLGDGSTFTAAGGASLGASAYQAVLTVGNFQNFTATGSNPLVATGGGTVNLSGSGTANARLTIAGDANVTVGGTGSTSVSKLQFSSFGTTAIGHSLTAGSYGNLYLNGSTGGTTINGSDLTATGTSAILWLNYNSGTTGNLTFSGSAYALNGGTLYLDGTPGGANTASFTGNLTASGANSQLYYRYYANPSFGATQLFSATAGGKITFNPTTAAAGNSITFQPGSAPNSSSSLQADGSGSQINVANYNSVTVGTPVSATNYGQVNFSTIGNSAFSITTAGDSTGTVNVSGRAAAGTYPALALANVQATGSALKFTGFGNYTLDTSVPNSVAANAGRLDITGFTTSTTSGTPPVTVTTKQSRVIGNLSVLNGGLSYLTNLNVGNLTDFSARTTLSVAAASFLTLDGVDLTNTDLVIDGTLKISNTVTFGGNPAANTAMGTAGHGVIFVNPGGKLTLFSTTSLGGWSTALTLTGRGTLDKMYPTTNGSLAYPHTIQSDIRSAADISSNFRPALTINALPAGQSWNTLAANPIYGTSQTFYNKPYGILEYTGGGGLIFNGFTDGLDNQGLVEVTSNDSILSSAGGLFSHIFSSQAAFGTVRANGSGVGSLPLNTATKSVVEEQNIQAVNGALILFNGFDVKNDILTSSPITSGDTAGSFQGGTGVVLNAGTATQNVSALSTFTDATLTGTKTVLQLTGSQKIALGTTNTSGYGLTVTGQSQLQLTGAAGQQILSTGSTSTLGRILVLNNAILTGAGNSAAHQIGLNLGSLGTLKVYNPNLPTTKPNLANSPPAVPAPFTFSAASVAGAGTAGTVSAASVTGATADQTLTVLGDLQMSPNSTLSITIFGNTTNANSLLMAGSASTVASNTLSTLNGNISVTVAAGAGTILPTTLFVVLQENGAGFGTSRFGNAPSTGSTITSADGNWIFGVNYIGNQVILGNPTAVPEPSTWTALAGLAAFGLVAYRNRRRSPAPQS